MDLSVVVPVYNEEDFVSESLHSIVSCLMDSSVSYEIIVVNNGSSDQSLNIISNFSSIKVFSIDRSTVAAARNFGASKSTGDVLAFIDGDVKITNKWVSAIEELIKNCSEESVLTGFQCDSRPDGTWIERCWFSGLDSSHINSGNLIISKIAFDYLGGFTQSLTTGEDVDICERAKQDDRIEFEKNKNFFAIHLDYPRTIKRFFFREVWHGEGDFKNLRYFLKSKIAIMAVFYGISTFSAITFMFLGEFRWFFFTIAGILVFNILVTAYRVKKKNGLDLFLCCFLNYIYFIGRFFSLFSVTFGKKNKF